MILLQKNTMRILLTIIFFFPWLALKIIKIIVAIPGSIPILGLPFVIIDVIIQWVVVEWLFTLMVIPHYQEIKQFDKSFAGVSLDVNEDKYNSNYYEL